MKAENHSGATWLFVVCLVLWMMGMLLFGGGCKTTNYNSRSKQSAVDPRVTVHYDKKGNVKGTSKQSPIDPRVTIYRKKK